MLRLDLCDYSDTYISVQGTIALVGTNSNNRRDKLLSFKNNAPFRSCISKINNTFMGNTENFDMVMWAYNLLEYGDNYSITSGILWNDYGNEMDDNANGNNADTEYMIARQQQVNLLYKKKIIGSLPDGINTLKMEFVASLKHLTAFD